ncbi:putative GTPase activating protein for Arf-domain-containing protein [Hypoxylon argillaceum]|nr:putative GTPase activating protein for Arf-domain-containing protein [Hypoxylon argillaceum]
MRCAAIHRKLGTHISKVKSLSMDSWSNDQVEGMKRIGNAASNKTYNPQSKRPPIPIDADEADSAMERFIRSKYVQPPTRTPTSGPTRQNTGSSDEGTPPPLPPKTGTRFFKSGTLSFRSKKDSQSPRESTSPQYALPPRDENLRNKPSKVFGASVHQDSVEATAQKLTQLRDMGFADDKRNAMILKGVNGNLEKTIEALVRLGEGSGGISPGLTMTRNPLSRATTPKPTKTVTNGLSKPSPPLPVESPSSPSNDPWEIQPAQPQSSQSTGTLQNKNPFYNNNPFGAPSQQVDFPLNQSMQSLSLAPSQPALFPHHTGGAPVAQPVSQPTYAHSMTPPVPQLQSFTPVPFGSNQTYPPPLHQQPQQLPQQGYNPFLQAPTTPQQPLSLNTSPYQYQGSLTSNPFTRSPTGLASPMLNQIPEQSQQNVYNSPQTPYSANPFMTMSQPAQVPPQPTQQPWFQQNQQPQQQAQFMQPNYPTPQPQRADKDSIMALYGYVQPAPASTQSPGQLGQATSNPFELGRVASPQPQIQTSLPQGPSVGTNNPFLNNAPAPVASAFAPTNQAPSSARSRESMMLGMEMAWNNGRHSPDAFASLSARSG